MTFYPRRRKVLFNMRGARRCSTDEVVELHLRNRCRSENTRRAYREEWARWRAWLALGPVAPTGAKPLHVVGYLAGLDRAGKSRAVQRRALAAVRAIYASLAVAGKVRRNPAAGIKIEKDE